MEESGALLIWLYRYYITMGLRSMHWDEWIGSQIRSSSMALANLEHQSWTITTLDITQIKLGGSKSADQNAARPLQKPLMEPLS